MIVLSISTNGMYPLRDRFEAALLHFEVRFSTRTLFVPNGVPGSEDYAGILHEKYVFILDCLNKGFEWVLYSDLDVRFYRSPLELPMYSFDYDIVAQRGSEVVHKLGLHNPVLGFCALRNTDRVRAFLSELVGYSQSVRNYTETTHIYTILKKSKLSVTCWPSDLVSSGLMDRTGCVAYHANHVRTVEEKLTALYGIG